MKTIVGMYDDLSDARQVVQELVNTGIDRERISLVAGDSEGRYAAGLPRDNTTGDTTGDNVAGGAATGAVVGGLGGLLLGLGALAIPGIGPIIAAGPIVSALVGAGVGAAVGGLVGALTEAGVPEEQAGYYAEGVRRGSTLVTVEAPDQRVDEVVRVMDRFHPIDINQRASSWRQEGWTGFHADDDTIGTTSAGQARRTNGINTGNRSGMTDTRTSTQTNRDRTRASAQNFDDDDATFEVVEEELNVGKRQVEQGGVRVSSHIEEKPVEEQVHLREERVNVERRPVDRPANAADFQAFKEGTVEVTATSEEPVVEKRARVVEEVVVNKDVQERTETVRDTVRRKDVDVEQVNGGNGYGSFDRYDAAFRSNWQQNYANSGYTYEQYQPAYRFGYTLANDPRYQGRDWNAIEADARRTWSQQYKDTPWENFKDAVRHGWQQVRQTVAG
jgi:uncharacterized protein (TIGR02271 family)